MLHAPRRKVPDSWQMAGNQVKCLIIEVNDLSIAGFHDKMIYRSLSEGEA